MRKNPQIDSRTLAAIGTIASFTFLGKESMVWDCEVVFVGFRIKNELLANGGIGEV